jgi:Uma2 family endonuclease
VLYPEVGDFIVHTKAHEDICHYLADVLKMQVRHDPSAVVLHDVRVAWGIPEMRPNGPDIALIYGVQEHKNWSTFDCGEEGVRPIVVIEVTSPETRSNDLLEKVEIYEQAGVEHYIIIDSRAWKGREQFYLHSYQLGPTGYQLSDLDDLGRVRIGALDVWLGIEETHISCYNADGERIGDYVAVEVARTAAEVARAAAEKDRRAARVAEAEAEARANRAAAAQAEAEAEAAVYAQTAQAAKDAAAAYAQMARAAQAESAAYAQMVQVAKDAAAAYAQNAQAAQAESAAYAQMVRVAQDEAKVQANAFEARLRDLEAELRRLRGALGDTSSP